MKEAQERAETEWKRWSREQTRAMFHIDRDIVRIPVRVPIAVLYEIKLNQLRDYQNIKNGNLTENR